MIKKILIRLVPTTKMRHKYVYSAIHIKKIEKGHGVYLQRNATRPIVADTRRLERTRHPWAKEK